jgi:transcription elongation GreA/GreB family factor
MTINKHKIIEVCKKKLSDQMDQFVLALKEMAESMSNETKSSAGDKHETARAKMQFEMEKLEKQLNELKLQWNELVKVDPSRLSTSAGFGALVQTNRGLFFISISLGKVDLENETVFVISLQSPLAQSMKGLKTQDTFEFNGSAYFITNVA